MTLQEIIKRLKKAKDFLQSAKSYNDKDYIDASIFEIESILKEIGAIKTGLIIYENTDIKKGLLARKIKQEFNLDEFMKYLNKKYKNKDIAYSYYWSKNIGA